MGSSMVMCSTGILFKFRRIGGGGITQGFLPITCVLCLHWLKLNIAKTSGHFLPDVQKLHRQLSFIQGRTLDFEAKGH